MLRRQMPEFPGSFGESRRRLRRMLDFVSGDLPGEIPDGVNILSVYPHPQARIHWVEKRRDRLLPAVRDTATRVMRLFANDTTRPIHEVQLVRTGRDRQTGIP